MERVGEETMASNNIELKGQVNDVPGRESEAGNDCPGPEETSGVKISVEELTLRNYRKVQGSNNNNMDNSRVEHLYRLPKGSVIRSGDEELNSQPRDMDQMLSRIRQQLAGVSSERQNLKPFMMSKRIDQNLEAFSERLRTAGENNTPAWINEGVKTPLSSSSFSQLLLQRAMKGKEVVEKNKILGHTKSSCGISLREFLRSNYGKEDKKRHSLCLLRQLVDLVDSVHSQGLFLVDLRPSFFTLVSSKKLRYIGTFGNNDLSSDLHVRPYKRKRPVIDLNVVDECNPDSCELQKQNCNGVSSLTRNQSTCLEEQWYSSPEVINGEKSNIYALGVLLFELLCHYESSEKHTEIMADLRHRILPPTFLSRYSKEAGFCLWFLHPEPSSRPTAREILKSELICDNDSVISTAADEEISELLLHFLSSLEEKKQKHESKLLQDIQTLEDDIKEAEVRYSLNGSLVRRVKSEALSANTDRLMSNISHLEDAYFFMRSQMKFSDKSLIKDRDIWSEKRDFSDQVEVFFDGLCKFSRYSKFETCGSIKSGDLLNSASVICSLSFDPDEEHIAAAGISKKIKIFYFNAFMNESVSVHYPLVEMINKSKLSCVCWNSYIKNYLASTDYDGVVQIWDAGTGQGFSQYTEHQKRAWSVDFSPSDPTKFVSGSDDCSVKLWSVNEKRSLGTIWSPANVCCVQFSAYSNNLVAFGSADYKVYCYDLRYVKSAWCILAGHEKAVSYVKFMDSDTIVSASTDNSLKLWNLNKINSSGLSPSLTYKGHTNHKNFVGLSVLDGYIACGSETNEVYSYYRSLRMAMTSHKFGSVDSMSGNDYSDDNGQFVSSVCWRKKSNMLVAANSTGNMKLLKLV